MNLAEQEEKKDFRSQFISDLEERIKKLEGQKTLEEEVKNLKEIVLKLEKFKENVESEQPKEEQLENDDEDDDD